VKYFIEVPNKEWVPETQLEPKNKDVPLPKKPEDIPEKGVEAWIMLDSGRRKPVTIRKMKCKVKFSTRIDMKELHVMYPLRSFYKNYILT
jgi:hypothetical protein